MIKVILFSPNGYAGGFIKEKLQNDKSIDLYLMERGNDWRQYCGNYDVMIYSASITSARHETARKYIQDNIVTAVSIVDFCKERHIRRIIYLSSDEIYGNLNMESVTEQAIMVDPGLYGTTKYIAEKIIMECGIPYYILRLPGIVGRVWGSSFIYHLMDKIKKNEPIELYNINKMFNNIVDIDDLTKFIHILCMEKFERPNEIFLLGNTEKVELREVVCYIKYLYHSKTKIKSVDMENRRYFTLDVTKAVKYGYSSKKINTILDELYLL